MQQFVVFKLTKILIHVSMLINCDIQDYTISASGSIAVESQAPLTLFKLCLPSNVIIPTLMQLDSTQNHLVLKRTLNKEFLDIQATIECGFTLKRVRDMTRTYSPTLVITSFFGFVSGVEAFNFDVLLFCLLPNKGTLSFTFLYAILSSRVTVALIDCLAQMLSFLPQFVQNCLFTLLI